MAIYTSYGPGTAAMLALGWGLLQAGTIELSMFIGLMLFLFESFAPLKAFYGQVARLTVMNACLDRIEAIFQETELDSGGTLPLPESTGGPEIEFRDVSFAYQDREVLRHISFTMERNSMTALVGPSGSGKSTIASLLPRFWDVQEGQVLLRGRDIRSIPLGRMNATRGEVEKPAFPGVSSSASPSPGAS